MFKSWKTTMMGVVILIVLVAKLIQDIVDGNPIDVVNMINMVAVGALGIFSRDNDKSSEEAGARTSVAPYDN